MMLNLVVGALIGVFLGLFISGNADLDYKSVKDDMDRALYLCNSVNSEVETMSFSENVKCKNGATFTKGVNKMTDWANIDVDDPIDAEKVLRAMIREQNWPDTIRLNRPCYDTLRENGYINEDSYYNGIRVDRGRY